MTPAGGTSGLRPADRVSRLPVHPEVEDVEAVVVADDVVHLLWLDARRQVDLPVDDALLVDQCLPHRPSVRAEDARQGAVRAAHAVGDAGVARRGYLDHLLGDGRA